MKETTIAASDFKAKCLSLIAEVAEKGTSLVITRGGLPAVRLTPVQPAVKALMGSWKGIVQIKGDLINLGSEDDWTGDEENLKPRPKRRKSR